MNFAPFTEVLILYMYVSVSMCTSVSLSLFIFPDSRESEHFYLSCRTQLICCSLFAIRLCHRDLVSTYSMVGGGS